MLDLFRVAKHPERLTVHQLARPFGGETGDHIDGGDHLVFLLAPEAAERLAGGRTTPLSLNATLELGIIPGHPVN
ncbi:hypothetical protein [Streptomyces sp. NPDC051576]|uniref:hypothetical protein n=1 Tax=Streptomyces sp. NPDC051576 TaxID=3155803 RepID=UPI00343BA0E0